MLYIPKGAIQSLKDVCIGPVQLLIVHTVPLSRCGVLSIVAGMIASHRLSAPPRLPINLTALPLAHGDHRHRDFLLADFVDQPVAG